MTEQFEATFIICTYNRADYLRDSLASLCESGKDKAAAFEILVIDNNSSDETPSVVQQISKSNPKVKLRYIKETQQGLSFARNRGIRESNAPNVVFLDDDIIASESLIPAWLDFFKNHPRAVAAGGRIRVQFDDPRPDWMSYFLLPLLGHHDMGSSKKKYPKNQYPFGGNMGFSKTIFQEVGDFNTGLGRKGESLNAGEEKDLFQRLRDKYTDIYYLPEAFLYHRVNKSRLTKEYIRKQALGLGESMSLRLDNAGTLRFLTNWAKEITKLGVSLPLAIGYMVALNPAKAITLFQFRWWIWKGYRQNGH